MSGLPDEVKSREIGDIQTLIAALAHDDPVERHHARESLVAIGTPAVKSLIMLLSDRRSHVRWEAAKALGPIGDPAAAAALANALEDRDSDVRWLAAAGLIKLGCSGLHPLLTALLERPKSDWLRDGAHHVFHDLVGRVPFGLARSMLAALDQAEPEMAVPQAAYEALTALESLTGTLPKSRG
jgi:HEAT repeat protein